MEQKYTDRFWSRVEVRGPDDCWLWQGGTTTYGYGSLRIGPGSGKHWLTHRFSLSLVEALLPGLLVLHSCDNPPCVNPRHLHQGTHAENSGEMAARGRSTYGERSTASKLTAPDVLAIRARVSAGEMHKLIAPDFGVSKGTVGDIANRRTWAHV